MNRRPQDEVSHIDTQTLRNYLERDYYETLTQVIQEDLLLGEKLKLRNQLKDLIILQQYFIDFCNNFVNCKDFYEADKRAAFEAGTLILDGKIFELTIPLDKVSDHSKIAKSSGMFCLYLQVTAKSPEEPNFICAPVCALRNKVDTVGKQIGRAHV